MKNIVFFVESMYCGGAERSLLSLLSNIDPSLYNIDLLVINKGGKFEKFIPPHINYKSADIKFGFLGKLKFKLYQKFLSKRHNAQFFWKAFKNNIPQYKNNYDIAIGWGQGFATYYTAEKIKAKRKIAWVNTDYQKAGYIEKFDKEKYEKIDVIVGISDFVKLNMQKFLSKEKLVTIRNIIDSTDIINRADSEIEEKFDKECFNIVSVGRLAKPKAFNTSIKTAKILKENNINFRWYIIGEGSERPQLESLIEKFNLKDYVILLGFRDNPYPYIKASDIYVQTSSFEGLGRTLIEASILCKPVVTTNFPTAFDIFEPNETAIITEMDADSVAKGILKLIKNDELKTHIIQNLKNKVNSDKELIIKQVNELFQE